MAAKVLKEIFCTLSTQHIASFCKDKKAVCKEKKKTGKKKEMEVISNSWQKKIMFGICKYHLILSVLTYFKNEQNVNSVSLPCVS